MNLRPAARFVLTCLALVGIASADDPRSVAPRSTHGGACTLGTPQLLGAAKEPIVPTGVLLALNAKGGMVAWLAREDHLARVQPVGPLGQKVGSPSTSLKTPLRALLSLTADGGGYMLVGKGGTGTCNSDCVVAQALDASGAPVGPPASLERAWSPDIVLPTFLQGPDGLTTILADGLTKDAVEIHVTRGSDGAAVVKATPIPEGKTSTSRVMLAEEGGERVALLGPDNQSVALWSLGVLHPAVPVNSSPVALTHGSDGWSVWFPAGLDAQNNRVPATRRRLSADGTLGPPLTDPSPDIVKASVDTGVAQDAQGKKLEGLLFRITGKVDRTPQPTELLLGTNNVTMARAVIATPTDWVAAWVADTGAGWQLSTRTAHCPASAAKP